MDKKTELHPRQLMSPGHSKFLIILLSLKLLRQFAVLPQDYLISCLNTTKTFHIHLLNKEHKQIMKDFSQEPFQM